MLPSAQIKRATVKYIDQQLSARARCNVKGPVTRFYFYNFFKFTSTYVEFANLNLLKIATIVDDRSDVTLYRPYLL